MIGMPTGGHDDAEPAERSNGNAPPLVSIIMANYNGHRYIESALQSALSQSMRNIEVIVADDASTDGSADLVAAFASRDARVRLLRAPANGGSGVARNLCLDAACGRWVAVMDSDDLMHPDRLEWLVAAAERDGADIVADDLLIFDENPAVAVATCLHGNAAASAFWVAAADYVHSNTLFSGAKPLGYLKPLIRRSLITDNAHRYDPTLRIAEDFDFIMRLLVRGARLRVYPELLYFYRKHRQSVSHRLSRATLQPMLAAHDRLPTVVPGDRDTRLKAALAKRRTSLERALLFDDLVSALKRGDWVGAVAQAIRHPRVAALLRGPLVERLQRLRTDSASVSIRPAHQVCVLSRQRIIGNTNGSSVYLLSLCAALSENGCDVHLLCPSPALFGRWPALLLRPEMRMFRSIRLRRAMRVGPLLITTDPGTAVRAVVGLLGKAASRLGIAAGQLNKPAPYAVSQPWTRQDLLFVAQHARTQADVVIADYAFLTDGIPYVLRPDALSLVVMHDLFSSRSAQFNRLGAADSVAAIEQQAEMALLARADAVVAIQAAEACTVRRCLPGQHVIVAPIAITPVAEPQPGIGSTVLFVGSNTAPNIFGLRWFLEAIWPLVRAGVPDATLQVVGSVCGTVRPPSDGVQLLGSVRDLAAIYQQSAVVISPLQAGSGLKIKLIEALSRGKAVVATSVTLQGVEQDIGGAVSVADDAAEFAAAVIALLTDEVLRMARATAALELARMKFSSMACYAELLAFVSTTPRRSPCKGT
jgi:succinoglycan biosynthesis protein ExoO